jgi:hypothetical protein
LPVASTMESFAPPQFDRVQAFGRNLSNRHATKWAAQACYNAIGVSWEDERWQALTRKKWAASSASHWPLTSRSTDT